MSRKQVMVCDGCGTRSEGNQLGQFAGWIDLRVHDRAADVCSQCVQQLLAAVPGLSCLFPCEADYACNPRNKCRVHSSSKRSE